MPLNTLLSQIILMLFVFGFIGAALVYLAGYFSILPEGINKEVCLLIVLYICIESVAQLIDHIFILEKTPVYSLLKGIVNSSVRLALVVGAAIFFGEVYFMVLGIVVLSLLRITVLISFLAKRYNFSGKLFDRDLVRRQLKYIAPLAAASVIGVCAAKFDKIIISYQMSAADFSIYTIVGLGLMSAVTMLYTSIGNVCLPKLSGFADKDDFNGAIVLWHKMMVINATITIPAVVFCFVMAPIIMNILFGEAYEKSAEDWRINLFILIMQM